MIIDAILNQKELWLPEYVKHSGRLIMLKPESLLTKHGIIIPTYRGAEFKDKLYNGGGEFNTFGMYDASLEVITDADTLYSYRVDIGLRYSTLYLDDTYHVIGTRYSAVDLAQAANYMFSKGLLKTPQDFLKRFRAHWCNSVPFIKYDLAELLKARQDKFGDIVKPQ